MKTYQFTISPSVVVSRTIHVGGVQTHGKTQCNKVCLLAPINLLSPSKTVHYFLSLCILNNSTAKHSGPSTKLPPTHHSKKSDCPNSFNSSPPRVKPKKQRKGKGGGGGASEMKRVLKMARLPLAAELHSHVSGGAEAQRSSWRQQTGGAGNQRWLQSSTSSDFLLSFQSLLKMKHR